VSSQGWCEIRPALADPFPSRPAARDDLTAALLAAATGPGRLEVRVVAEPYRVAVAVPDDPATLRVLAALLPTSHLHRIPDLFTRPLPVASAAARLRPRTAAPPPARPGRGYTEDPPGGLLLAAVAAASLGDDEAAEVRLRLRPAGRAVGSGGMAVGAVTAAAALAGGVIEVALEVVAVLLAGSHPAPGSREPRRPAAPDTAVVEVPVAVTARWYAADPATARSGLGSLIAASGLRRSPLPLASATRSDQLAALLEAPAQDHRRPVHLTPAVPRGGEPVGPAPPATILLGRSQAGREFALAPGEFAGHGYVIGPSGTGKTTLLARLVTGLSAARVGVVVLDPHGDLSREVLATLPAADLARAAVVDLSDPASLPVINPLYVPATGDPAAVAAARSVRAAAVAAMFADLWGLERAATPNLLHFLHAALAALVAAGGCLSDLPAFLTDPAYRAGVIRRGGDDRVRRRWAEFAALGREDRSRTARAILNKAAEFDRDDVVATVFGEPGPGLAVADVLDGGGLLLVHLPRGTLPEGAVGLVGSLFVTMLHQAALARETRPAAERPLAVAVIDEFQEFALRSFAQVVTATRKYGLGLVVANQNLSRVRSLSPDVLSTLLSNVATLAAFRPGADDAAALATQFHPLSAATLLSLPPRTCCWRLAGGGAERTLVTAATLPPPAGRRDYDAVTRLIAELRLRVPHRPVRTASAATVGQADPWR
jgi:hypothetical protein